MCRALVAVLHGLATRLLDGLLHYLGHDRTAIQLFDVGDRHLALAKALELDLVLDLVDARVEALAELALPHHDFQLALETGRTRLGNLHFSPQMAGLCTTRCCHLRVRWCGRR